jgi:hypothetical protein
MREIYYKNGQKMDKKFDKKMNVGTTYSKNC